eukprot:gene8368-8552_t
MAAQFRQLQESDLEDVMRLHRFASYEGQPVFAQYGQDAAAVLQAAVQATDGAFGVAALLPDPEEPSEIELVGAATGQLVMPGDAESYQGAAGGAVELVLLTLVVRGDARGQGLGAALLAHLIRLGHQQQQQQRGHISRVIADVSVTNKPAWGLFQKFGFIRGTPTATTAEAILDVPSTSFDKLLQATMTRSLRSTAARAAPSLGSRVSNICGQGMLRRFANFPRAGVNSR